MKIDVGAAAIAVLGVPFLLCAGWFSWHGVTGNCMRLLPGNVSLCGGALYAISGVFVLSFAAIVGLAWLWRD
jgi:hypothetical protein